MASHDQSNRAGEAHGRLEERKNQMMGTTTDKTEAAKDKTYETAQARKAQDTGNGPCHEGEDEGVNRAVRELHLRKAGAAKQKAYETAEAAKEKASHMAHGAKEAVKHTFGMAGEDEDVPIYRNRTSV